MGTEIRTAAGYQSALELALEELRASLGDRATAGEAARHHHSHGESTHPPGLPDLVCFPQTTSEVSQIMQVSALHGLPVVPFGAACSHRRAPSSVSAMR